MTVILVQGHPCLGKTSLCNRLVADLPACKHMPLDSYKEFLWDVHGFDSAEQREQLSDIAKQTYFSLLALEAKWASCEYLLLDYAWKDKLVAQLECCVPADTEWKTLYLYSEDEEAHAFAWAERARDFTRRHPGHGAVEYHNGVGFGYCNAFVDKKSVSLGSIGQVLRIGVEFNPYSLTIPYENILAFVK